MRWSTLNILLLAYIVCIWYMFPLLRCTVHRLLAKASLRTESKLVWEQASNHTLPCGLWHHKRNIARWLWREPRTLSCSILTTFLVSKGVSLLGFPCTQNVTENTWVVKFWRKVFISHLLLDQYIDRDSLLCICIYIIYLNFTVHIWMTTKSVRVLLLWIETSSEGRLPQYEMIQMRKKNLLLNTNWS